MLFCWSAVNRHAANSSGGWWDSTFRAAPSSGSHVSDRALSSSLWSVQLCTFCIFTLQLSFIGITEACTDLIMLPKHVTSSSMLRPSVSCQNEDGGLCCYSAKPAGFTLQIYFSWTIFCSKRWQIYWIIICWCKVSNWFEGVCSKNVVNCSKPSWLTSGILVFRRFN